MDPAGWRVGRAGSSVASAGPAETIGRERTFLLADHPARHLSKVHDSL